MVYFKFNGICYSVSEHDEFDPPCGSVRLSSIDDYFDNCDDCCFDCSAYGYIQVIVKCPQDGGEPDIVKYQSPYYYCGIFDNVETGVWNQVLDDGDIKIYKYFFERKYICGEENEWPDPTFSLSEPEPTPSISEFELTPTPTPTMDPTPTSTISEPEPSESEPEPTPTISEPEPSESEAEPTPTISEPEPSESEPTLSEPEPTPTISEPEPSESEPEPTPTVSDPEPSEPDPTVVISVPFPSDSEPEPSALAPEPSSSSPEPTPNPSTPPFSWPGPSSPGITQDPSLSEPEPTPTPLEDCDCSYYEGKKINFSYNLHGEANVLTSPSGNFGNSVADGVLNQSGSCTWSGSLIFYETLTDYWDGGTHEEDFEYSLLCAVRKLDGLWQYRFGSGSWNTIGDGPPLPFCEGDEGDTWKNVPESKSYDEIANCDYAMSDTFCHLVEYYKSSVSSEWIAEVEFIGHTVVNISVIPDPTSTPEPTDND